MSQLLVSYAFKDVNRSIVDLQEYIQSTIKYLNVRYSRLRAATLYVTAAMVAAQCQHLPAFTEPQVHSFPSRLAITAPGPASYELLDAKRQTTWPILEWMATLKSERSQHLCIVLVYRQEPNCHVTGVQHGT